MNTGDRYPNPHNFSRSPVEEVFCSLEIEDLQDNVPQVSVFVKAPYPGWNKIRDSLAASIATLPDYRRVSGFTLRYTDRFLIKESVYHQITGEIRTDLCNQVQISDTAYEFHLNIPNPAMKVQIRSWYDTNAKPGWILVFTVKSTGNSAGSRCEEILDWFDSAHAEIHILFDQIVPAAIVDLIT
ncbi:MAG: TIGR04255 family protein [Methanospirillum sp.]|uniref:TIGR04255 family protein n=1 Tax=Methanospirillum sp. TaxID=45200 RepID=UPI0023699290|nr:TIGR04255 family protein [Methanospirillum sp.]MDD1727778.1 TIGR04255 family protein [Methanospirillum sp.]